MSSWFIRTHEVDPNSTTIYRILRTRTVAFLGGGGGDLKVLERRVKRVTLSDDLTIVTHLGRRKKVLFSKHFINRLSMVKYSCTQRFRLSLYLNLLHEWIVLNCSTYDRLYKQISISTEYFRFHGDSLQHFDNPLYISDLLSNKESGTCKSWNFAS